ncbi:disease resistance protein UNI-like [Prosopis cineraria]|uniref:disease resistance protein UNI-like n=1 Tax=Prosopis cineraria TaxID=364024 RepID=UPI00241041DB|nr:disease resistance protein UNI-like [Prosopis cineraria]XP_054819161.1 disease resistance protein UNI-like [Prosopis cineraria]XP_054819162.1 disease resistance protein UNI-like [Prosopis cineraria]XP_054819164.1 disease resistance protein UNI-like [Prosopis cineraria]XP_054819165.1 disease resistance protein UNI-like [Prosopis cineraria]XP_054819166.1 disease resistance protein UNI-like [Prosopis cineraria]XP_054819167.1 disease resistance protein UNI-like [Prosopis cineraria]XP_05481916
MAGIDFGINFGAGLAVNIVTAVGRQACYCYEFNKLVIDMGDEQNNLISTRDGMLVQFGKDKANSKEPPGDLQLQLKAANDLLDKVEKLKGKADAKQSCCLGVCPNWICRYIVGKKADEKTKAMKQLNNSLRLKLLSAHRLSLRPMQPSEDFILFKCIEEARKKILMALRDNEKTRIGLSGMGGCGKSSLLREVQREVEESKLYKTAFAVVSNPPNYIAIQDSIANWIGLLFEREKNVPDRAARLSMTSGRDDKKYFIILDDVWDVLDFEAIGLPVGAKCKVLLSTRQQPIFDIMKFDEKIYLSILTDEESWELFQRHAGEIKDPFPQVAREITNNCYRLPVAIKAVASILRGHELHAWTESLATLQDRRRPLNIEKGLEDPCRCLKLSLDSLKDAEEVSLYLLCALFPNDSEIAIEVLIKFAFGLGVFQDIDSYQRARSKVRAAIDKFQNYCLLLKEGQFVKLHDMFHALALWEAKKKTQVIMGPRQILALIEADHMKDTNRLYCHDIQEIPDQLNCPELEILFVSNNGGYSSKFPNMFFQEMTKLKVLAIKNTSIGTSPNLLLPESIEGLKKLQTLCWRGWTLINISIFQKLEMLHTIELLYCEMKELPGELANLKALKLLEVSNCKIGGNPYEVLATCLHLEELYLVKNHLPEMVQIGQNVAKFFHQIGSFSILQRYHLEIGGPINKTKDDSLSKLISINDFDASISNEAIQALPQTPEVLFFEKIWGDCKSIIPDMFPVQGECLNELKEFVLRDSDCIKWLIDTTNDQLYKTRTSFTKLQKLKVEAMKCLETLCHGPPPSGLFENLKKLFITKCSQLASLFTTTTAQKMVTLEVLEVIGCGKLRYIIKVENSDNTSAGPVLQNLKQISVKSCGNMKCIMPISFASGLLQLEILEIEDAAKLQYVFGKDNLEKDQNQNQSIDHPSMKIFKLINLPIIISICPQNYHIMWQLDEQLVMRCPKWRDRSYLYSETSQQGGEKATKQAELLSMLGGKDFGINTGDSIPRDLARSASRNDQFNTLVRSLHEEKGKLLVKIEEVEANTAEPSGYLKRELDEAKDLIEKVEKLEGKVEASKNSCSWLALS